MTAIQGFTGESQCLVMLTNPCHRPQVDFATCSSCCSLFSSSLFSLPCPPLLIPVVFSSSSTFLFPCHSLFFPVILSSLSTLSLSLSLSSSPICLPQPFSFPVLLSLLCSRHLYSPPSLSFSFSLCLPLFLRKRSSCCKALLSIAC